MNAALLVHVRGTHSCVCMDIQAPVAFTCGGNQELRAKFPRVWALSDFKPSSPILPSLLLQLAPNEEANICTC